MDEAAFQANLERGRRGEERFLRHLAAKGLHVVPVYASGEGKAPKVYVDDRRVTAADVLALDARGSALWFEVKTKGKPGYRYRGDARGWEHGIDYRLFAGDYRELSARAPLWIVVCEELTIPGDDLTWEPPEPPRLATGYPDWQDYARHLVAGPVWRMIRYELAEQRGRRVPGWSDGKDGWLFPVSAMTRIEVAGAHQ